MAYDIKWGSDYKGAGEFLASSVMNKLKKGKKVLLFLTGGSSIKVGIFASHIFEGNDYNNLVITLTDERYGKIGHSESNWQGLINEGFNPSRARLYPILNGKGIKETVYDFNKFLKSEINESDYKIGLFGVGVDAHTAGILPYTIGVDSNDFAVGYDTEKFRRITITQKTISMLDEAILFMHGKEKWEVLNILKKEKVDLDFTPVVLLKNVPKFTIFTDKQNI
ncbi:MAG: 6-phosphogluconolactonase [Candidatus Paceibacterota bacterium]|jgi:6-phosphogluconolactonase/glucosamine-6-phosphate isomerase/deaminase